MYQQPPQKPTYQPQNPQQWQQPPQPWGQSPPQPVPQRLATACSEFGIEQQSHRALGDAQAARQVLLKLAEKE